ncbi:MAG: hypothetical protein P4L87_23540, partial [Formivibrio sp.]|nr:hypothetical protein [Formivibrio sp.]
MLMLLIRLTLYAITLLVYAPYLIFSLRNKYYTRFPIVFFAFLGMFVYNAIGSIYVFVPHLRVSVFNNDYFSYKFSLMLILQVFMFYGVSLPYTMQAKPVRPAHRQERTAVSFMIFILIAAIGLILYLYVRNVGTPPGIRILTGGLTTQEVIQFRIAGTFALDDYYIYNVGFMTLPVILASLACTLYLKSPRKIYILLILACMVVTTFPGGKGNITRISILLLIIGVLYRRHYPSATKSSRKAWIVAGLVVVATGAVVLAMYRIYYGPDY